MNMALKIIGPCVAPCIFYFKYKRMHFQIFTVCEIFGMIRVSNFHKIFFTCFWENYNKCGHGHFR